MNIHVGVEQRSNEWHQIRLGKVTASRIPDVLARTKSGPAASRKNYMSELLCERLTGQTAPHFVSKEMQWGIDHEDAAKATYAFINDVDVKNVGFIDHPTLAMAGCSPDGLVGDDGMIEIKCPNSATHLQFLLTGSIDSKYHKQMQFQMDCARREWCDFVSFDPRMPEHLQIMSQRVRCDPELAENARTDIESFESEIQDLLEKLDNLEQ